MRRILSALLTAALLACAAVNSSTVNADAAGRAVEESIQAGGGASAGGQSDRKSFDAKAYGVAGDGTTNDAPNLQAALTAASGAGALDVLLPPGQYRLGAAITVPKNVRLVGFNQGTHPRPESGTWTPARNVDFDKGTVIRCTADAGNEAGPPCVTVRQNGALEGVSIYHPNQSPTAATPTPYPWAISFAGMDARVERVELVNAYKGIYVGNFSHRATVRDVTGQPLKVGVEVDKNLDVTRLQSVHFVPNWSYKTGDSNGVGGTENGPYVWQKANGTAFLFKRADGIQGTDLFALGYLKGMRFERSPGSDDNASGNGVTYGAFSNVDLEVCNACIDIADAAKTGPVQTGLSFTNVILVPYAGTLPAGIRAGPNNAGAAIFSNVQVWGAPDMVPVANEGGAESYFALRSARFGPTSQTSMFLYGSGRAEVSGVAFGSPVLHVEIGPSVARAIVRDLSLTGPGTLGISHRASPDKLITNHLVWNTPTFANSWVNYDATTHEPAAYALLDGNTVVVKGHVKSGTLGATVWTFPAGLRPSKAYRFSVYGSAGGAQVLTSVDVSTSGTLVINAGGNQFVDLNFRFQVPQL